MLTSKQLIFVGFMLAIVSAVAAHKKERCPKTNCKKECDIEKETEVDLHCCSKNKCCIPCVENEDCRCRDECIADAEVEDGLCKCGANKDKKCCKPCIGLRACELVPGATCKQECGTNELPIFGCCGSTLKCCVPCGTCDNSPASECVTGGAACPVDNPFAIGHCCKEASGEIGVCCSRKPKCGSLSINGSTNPFSCKHPTDASCGPPFEQYAQSGYCCVEDIYCCPQCGWDCVDKAGGDTCTNPQIEGCPNPINGENNDCCERGGFDQCCKR